jgi:hypothetical protein
MDELKNVRKILAGNFEVKRANERYRLVREDYRVIDP